MTDLLRTEQKRREVDSQRAKRLKATVTIEAAIELLRLENVSQDGDECASCPVCADDELTLYDEGDKAHCPACGFRGDVIALVQEARGLGFNQACLWLERAGGAGERCQDTTDMFSSGR